jgi:hypothetical protein
VSSFQMKMVTVEKKRPEIDKTRSGAVFVWRRVVKLETFRKVPM